MVSAVTADVYSPFHPSLVSEEGPQSSEEGSGVHSPVMTGPYSTHGDSYPLDVQHSTPMIAPSYDQYGHGLPQQPPNFDILEIPSSSARQVTFPPPYPPPHRNHIPMDYAVQSPVNSRLPHTLQGGPSMFTSRYDPSTERRLPGMPPHDNTYTRPNGTPAALPMNHDHRPSLVAPSPRSEPSQNAPISSNPTEKPRKETSSVVIACRQCRLRKIRCDSTRPTCHNCVRRNNECEYDPAPRRRGPDKRPGTRQRTCKKRPADGSVPPAPKRKRTTADRNIDSRDPYPSKVKENMQDSKPPTPPQPRQPAEHLSYPHQPTHSMTQNDLRLGSDPSPAFKQEFTNYGQYDHLDHPYYPKQSFPRQIDVNVTQFPDHSRRCYTPTSPPAADRNAWWDRLFKEHGLSTSTIFHNIETLINQTSPLLSFINTARLRNRFMESPVYPEVHPAFALACMAMSKLMSSSMIHEASAGQQMAVMYAREAERALADATGHSSDPTLAMAAFVLALFESSAYPEHSQTRAYQALDRLDKIIYDMRLAVIDKADGEVCIFTENAVPSIIIPQPIGRRYQTCSCIDFQVQSSADLYDRKNTYNIPWPDTLPEIGYEEIRRLVWSSVRLISEYVVQCEAITREGSPPFHLCDPANFRLLFPGEVVDRMSPHYRSSESLSPKEAIWALYCRSMLLWNFCNRFRQPSSTEDRVENTHEALMELQAIEQSLHLHQCNQDTTLIYTTREYLHNTRMLITISLRSSLTGMGRPSTGPIFKRPQAEEWLSYQEQVVRSIVVVVQRTDLEENVELTRKPFRINWFINQLAICLDLWRSDPTLDRALTLAKEIFIPIDKMNALWPCPEIQKRCEELRLRLLEACDAARIDAPFGPNYSLSHHLQSR